MSDSAEVPAPFPGLILAIETSCDETSVALVDGRRVLSNVVSSQVEMHRKWGGIVPEAAARAHVEAILPAIEEALQLPLSANGSCRGEGAGGWGMAELQAIAVTNRPGLIGALSVGVTAAKALAFSLDIPLIGVHHIEGHMLSPFAQIGEFDDPPPFPHGCLVASGGHTELLRIDGLGQYRLLGQTIDDASGEAFDKAARLLGLGYPGGAAIQRLAERGQPRYPLPKGLSGDTLDFSFSGFKTAVMRLVEREGEALDPSDAAASIQETIAGVLTERALRAVEEHGLPALTLVGGVAANKRLREMLAEGCHKRGVKFVTPPFELCTDNAAMIGLVGSFRLARGERDGIDLDCFPNADLGFRVSG